MPAALMLTPVIFLRLAVFEVLFLALIIYLDPPVLQEVLSDRGGGR